MELDQCGCCIKLSKSICGVLHELLQCAFFHRVQSLRNTQLQRGSPTGSQVLPEILFLRGPLSIGCAAPARSPIWYGLSMGCRLLQGTSTCSGVGSSRGCGWISALGGCPEAIRGHLASPTIYTMVCGGISAPAPGAPPPPPLWPGGSAGLFPSHIFFTLLSQMLCSIFHPFLST